MLSSQKKKIKKKWKNAENLAGQHFSAQARACLPVVIIIFETIKSGRSFQKISRYENMVTMVAAPSQKTSALIFKGLSSVAVTIFSKNVKSLQSYQWIPQKWENSSLFVLPASQLVHSSGNQYFVMSQRAGTPPPNPFFDSRLQGSSSKARF